MPSIAELIKSADPLTDEAARLVIAYREETTLIDFKLTFLDEDEKWLDITKDVMAFANTDGGYLAFGVKDKSFEMHADVSVVTNVLAASSFLGKTFFHAQVAKLGKRAKLLGSAATFPLDGPRSLYRFRPMGKQGGQADMAEVEAELDQIPKLAAVEPSGTPGLTQRWKAEKLDCYLYAQMTNIRALLIDRNAAA